MDTRNFGLIGYSLRDCFPSGPVVGAVEVVFGKAAAVAVADWVVAGFDAFAELFVDAEAVEDVRFFVAGNDDPESAG